MRGKAETPCPVSAGLRITPAYAGKRMSISTPSASDRDHPRLCGEKYFRLCSVADLDGSPPPMRGKVQSAPKEITQNRITPAYAGKSLNILWCMALLTGSPPPMRGKAIFEPSILFITRITPAYAGKRDFSDFWGRFT